MKKTILIAACALIAFSHTSYAQDGDYDYAVAVSPEIFARVEQMPSAPYDVNKHLAEKKISPAQPGDDRKKMVSVHFVVNEDGRLSNHQLIGSPGRGLTKEQIRLALDAVKNLPAWTAGKHQGKPVKVYFTLILSFKS